MKTLLTAILTITVILTSNLANANDIVKLNLHNTQDLMALAGLNINDGEIKDIRSKSFTSFAPTMNSNVPYLQEGYILFTHQEKEFRYMKTEYVPQDFATLPNGQEIGIFTENENAYHIMKVINVTTGKQLTQEAIGTKGGHISLVQHDSESPVYIKVFHGMQGNQFYTIEGKELVEFGESWELVGPSTLSHTEIIISTGERRLHLLDLETGKKTQTNFSSQETRDLYIELAFKK